jgi:Zn-dependent peptidase ImmA (M78 family)/transcriptional regulator with XRE-family HTH domain
MPLTMDTLAERILKAIEASGMTRRKLAEEIGMDPTALSKALSGKRHFKTLEVALISDALGVLVQDLYAEEETEPVSVAARAQPESGPAVEQALDRAGQILDLDQLLTELGLPASPPYVTYQPPADRPYRQGEWMARRLRSKLRLGAAPLPAEVASLATWLEEKLNVDVAIEPLPRGLDGLAIARRPFGLIMVSSSIPAHRQRYTMAHELGHLLACDGCDIIDENISIGRTPAESRANAFAAAFLMSAEGLQAAFGGSEDISEQLIADLLGTYRVSLDALAFRLHNAGMIDAAQRDAVRRMSSSRIALRQGRATDLQARGDRRWPGRLLDRAVQAYANGRISIRPVARLVGVDADILLEELAPPSFPLAGASAGEPSEDDDLVPML